MNRSMLISAISLIALAGCQSATTGVGTLAPVTPSQSPLIAACNAVTTADGVFKALSPALVIAHKISAADLGKEAATAGLAEAMCTTPPSDTSEAVIQLTADVAAIYLIIGDTP